MGKARHTEYMGCARRPTRSKRPLHNRHSSENGAQPPRIVIPAKSLPRTPIRGRYPVTAPWIPSTLKQWSGPIFIPLRVLHKAMVIRAKSLPRTRYGAAIAGAVGQVGSTSKGLAMKITPGHGAMPSRAPRTCGGVGLDPPTRRRHSHPPTCPSQGHGDSGEKPAPYSIRGSNHGGGGPGWKHQQGAWCGVGLDAAQGLPKG